jgi:hypothetical protein
VNKVEEEGRVSNKGIIKRAIKECKREGFELQWWRMARRT